MIFVICSPSQVFNLSRPLIGGKTWFWREMCVASAHCQSIYSDNQVSSALKVSGLIGPCISLNKKVSSIFVTKAPFSIEKGCICVNFSFFSFSSSKLCALVANLCCSVLMIRLFSPFAVRLLTSLKGAVRCRAGSRSRRYHQLENCHSRQLDDCGALLRGRESGPSAARCLTRLPLPYFCPLT